MDGLGGVLSHLWPGEQDKGAHVQQPHASAWGAPLRWEGSRGRRVQHQTLPWYVASSIASGT